MMLFIPATRSEGFGRSCPDDFTCDREPGTLNRTLEPGTRNPGTLERYPTIFFAAVIASSRFVTVPSSCCSYTAFRISPIRGPGVHSERERDGDRAEWVAGGRCSTPSARARSRNQSIAVQLNCPGLRPRQSDFARRASSSRSTLLRQPTERAVAHLVAHLEPRARLEMMRDEPEHLLADVVAVDRLDIQSIQKRGGGCDALLFVIHRANAAVDDRRRCRFTEVVTDGPEHDGQLLWSLEIIDDGHAPRSTT